MPVRIHQWGQVMNKRMGNKRMGNSNNNDREIGATVELAIQESEQKLQD
jgi:hypothetical protein